MARILLSRHLNQCTLNRVWCRYDVAMKNIWSAFVAAPAFCHSVVSSTVSEARNSVSTPANRAGSISCVTAASCGKKLRRRDRDHQFGQRRAAEKIDPSVNQVTCGLADMAEDWRHSQEDRR